MVLILGAATELGTYLHLGRYLKLKNSSGGTVTLITEGWLIVKIIFLNCSSRLTHTGVRTGGGGGVSDTAPPLFDLIFS